jgi:colicin import membrane protein/protein TonB
MKKRFERKAPKPPGEGSLLKPAVFSLALHILLLTLLGFSLRSTFTKGTKGIYRVTIAPMSLPGGGAGTMRGGSGEPRRQEIFEPVRQPFRVPSTEQKGEKTKKTEPVAKGKDSLEGLKPSRKDEKKAQDSSKALHQAMEDIRRQAALDQIRNRVARRQKEDLQSGNASSSGASEAGPLRSGGPGFGSPGTGGPGGGGLGAGPYGPGGSSSGSPSLLDIKLSDYYNEIWAKIKKGWTIPESLSVKKGDWETIIILMIERDGKLQKFWFEKRSGNNLYDQSAERAVKKAEPFPPLPKEWGENALEIGIRFHPE